MCVYGFASLFAHTGRDDLLLILCIDIGSTAHTAGSFSCIRFVGLLKSLGYVCKHLLFRWVCGVQRVCCLATGNKNIDFRAAARTMVRWCEQPNTSNAVQTVSYLTRTFGEHFHETHQLLRSNRIEFIIFHWWVNIARMLAVVRFWCIQATANCQRFKIGELWSVLWHSHPEQRAELNSNGIDRYTEHTRAWACAARTMHNGCRVRRFSHCKICCTFSFVEPRFGIAINLIQFYSVALWTANWTHSWAKWIVTAFALKCLLDKQKQKNSLYMIIDLRWQFESQFCMT